MKLSQLLFFTTKETPAETEFVSHQLMLRAGLVKQVASGIYTFLPLGLRVLSKVTALVRDEMNAVGAQELLLPFVQPAELWKMSGRWDEYGEELLRFQDRKKSWFVLSPTHEEIITDLAKEILTSYRKLPVVVYQIQIKFRDELRPRGGVIRAREFLMKDAYSFCRDENQMKEIYQGMRRAYERIFSRCRLEYKIVEAESGPIGGDISHEFIATAPVVGEDKIVECPKCGYCSKLEKASFALGEDDLASTIEPMQEVETPGIKTIKNLSSFLDVPLQKLLKTIIYETEKGFTSVMIRGDHQVNEDGLKRLLAVEKLVLASPKKLKELLGIEAGFVGPVGVNNLTLVVDRAVMQGRNFVAGANKKDMHIINVNPGRDFSPDIVGDLRFVSAEDRCSVCGAPLSIKKGLEVGHLFHLGYKYSSKSGALFLDETGEKNPLLMGCYGVGISRIMAAIIEQNNDDYGIVWPEEVAPFQAVVIPTSGETFDFSGKIYQELKENSVDVLWDDRDVSAGVKFKDSDLVGIPLKIIIGKNFLEHGKIEVKQRRTGAVIQIDRENFIQKFTGII